MKNVADKYLLGIISFSLNLIDQQMTQNFFCYTEQTHIRITIYVALYSIIR